MKIFLIWAARKKEIQKMIEKIQSEGHEISYWVGISDKNGENNIPGAIFHDHYSAWAGEPAEGLSLDDFEPPSKDLVEKMYKTESLVMTMMNKKFDRICVDERRHLYYNMLQYWYGIIKKENPDVVIFPTIPHTVYNFIIYEVAKLLNIKTIMFEDSWVSDRLLTYGRWEKGCSSLHDQVRKNDGLDFKVSDLSPDLQEYYKLQKNPKKKATPVYMEYWKRQNSTVNLIKSKCNIIKQNLKNPVLINKLFFYIIKQFKDNLKKDYSKVSIRPDFKKKYIYVPLSFQPERTTSPQGDMFVDQILMIETLACSLPKGWKIYVKEHPSQWWLRTKTNYSCNRYVGYYRKIAKITNVQLVPIDTDTFELIKNAQAVSVATGTAGWEALLRLKPVLLFAYPWYRDCPALFRVDSAQSCKKALDKIYHGYAVNEQQIINYLYSFDKATIHGYLESMVEKNTSLTKEESMDNIIHKIQSEVL